VGITPQTQAKLAAAPKKQSKSQGENVGKVFTVVEQLPEFPGGAQELYQYLARNIKYPKSAKERKAQGRVITQLVVRKDGSITDVKVVKGVDAELDAEAVRVISGMPKWQPGMQKGVAVDVKYTIPVTFRLDNPKKTSSDGGVAEVSYVAVVSYPKENNVVSVNDGEKVQIRNYNDKFLMVEGPATTGKIAFLINGKKSTEEEFKALDPKAIESITVIKKKESLAEMGYGDYDGAIMLKTK
jgi:TonB family protein